MKQNYFTKLFALIAGFMLLLSFPLSAAAENEILIGHVKTNEQIWPYDGFNNASNETSTIYFAVKIPAQMFESYIGTKLTGMRIGWGQGAEPKTPEMNIFVRESLNGPDIASGKKNVEFGWNDIKLDSPLTISEAKDLYLCCSVLWEPGSYICSGTYGYNLPAESHFVGNSQEVDKDGNIIWVDISSQNKPVLLLGILEAAGEEYMDKASLLNCRGSEFQTLDQPGSAWLVVKNDGTNDIDQIELTTAFGEKTWSYSLDLSKTIAGNQTESITGPIMALGNGVHQMWISKVNDAAVENPAKIDVNIIGIPAEIAAKYTHRPVVERWESESNYRSPVYVDDWFTPGVQPLRDKLTVVSHHVDDQYMIYHEFDEEVNNEDLQFLVDLAGGDKMRVYCPAFSLDRAYYPQNPLAKPGDVSFSYNFISPDFIQGLYNTAIGAPTFASLEAEVKDSKIEIKGNIEDGILPEGENLYLTVYLLEDGIATTSQEFPDDAETNDRYNGEWTHNDLIRFQPYDMYGEKISEKGSFSREIEFELEPDWIRSNMRVVAFLNRGNNHNHQQIINSVEKKLGDSGIDSAVADNGIAISVEGNNIRVIGSSSFGVYTLDGAAVLPEALSPGIYVVRAENENGVKVRKVVVK